jgi:hypothetical protein
MSAEKTDKMKERIACYTEEANCFPFLLSLLFQFLHSLRQRKNLMMGIPTDNMA